MAKIDFVPIDEAPVDEEQFQQWYKGWAKKTGLNPNPDDPEHHYDYRAAFRAGIEPVMSPTDNKYHWSSQFKDDTHPNLVVGGVNTKTGKPAKQPIQFVPLDRAMSRRELANVGVTEPTNTKERTVITNMLAKRIQERYGPGPYEAVDTMTGAAPVAPMPEPSPGYVESEPVTDIGPDVQPARQPMAPGGMERTDPYYNELPADPTEIGEIKPGKSYPKQLLGQLQIGGLRVGKAAVQSPKHVAWLLRNITELGPEGDRTTATKALEELVGKKAANAAQNVMDTWQTGYDIIIKNHPEWQYDPPKSFADLASSPTKFTLAIAGSLPVLVGAGILTAAGQPHAAMAMMYATEGQEARDDAIAYGASEEDADYVYHAYGSVASVIEQYLRINPALKLGKNTYNAVLHRTTQKVLRGGKGIGANFILPLAQETIEEPLQGAWLESSAKSVYGKKVPGGAGDYVDRRAQEALLGFGMALLPVAAGGGSASIKQIATRESDAERLVVSRVKAVETPTAESLRAEPRETITQQEQRARMFTQEGEVAPQAQVPLSEGLAEQTEGIPPAPGKKRVYVQKPPEERRRIPEATPFGATEGFDVRAAPEPPSQRGVADPETPVAPLSVPEGAPTPPAAEKGAETPIGTFRKKVKDSFGTWGEQEVQVLSIAEPRNVRGKTSDGNWAVDYEVPSTLGKTGRQTNTEYFFKKVDAQKWIKEVKSKPPAKPAAEKPALRGRKAQPGEATRQQIEIGEGFGLSEQQVVKRLQKAEARYIDLRNTESLTPAKKKELDFLTRKRTDIQALLGRDAKPLTRVQVERRAAQFEIPHRGRTTQAVMRDIVARAAEQRAAKEQTGWKEWKKGEPINVTPDKLLKYALQHEARGARVGYRAGQLDLTAKHTELLEFAENALPKGEYKLVVRAARRIVKGRTPAELQKVIKAVNKMVANYEKASAIAEVKAAIKTAKKAKLRPEFQKPVDDLARDFTLVMPRETTILRMESLLDAAVQQERTIDDIPQRLIDKALKILSDSNKATLKDFEVDDIRTITAAIGNLVNQNTLKNQLLFSRQKRSREEANAVAATAVETRWGKKYETQVGKATRNKMRNSWTWLKNISSWDQISLHRKARILGGKGSVAENLLYRGIKDAQRRTTEIQLDATDHIVETMKKQNIDTKMMTKWSEALGEKKAEFVKVALPEARAENGARVETVEMTRAERVHFLRFIKDPQNRAALLDDQNKGIVFRRDKTQKAIKLRPADVKAIVDSASSAEQELAKAMHYYINGRAGKINIKEAVADVWLKLMGFPLQQHDDYVHRERAGEHKEFDPQQTTANFQTKWLERMGIFKPRAMATMPFVIGDGFAEYSTDINRMATFAGKALAVSDASQLLKDRGFRTSVKEAFKQGDMLLSDLEQTVRFFQGLDKPAQGNMQRFAKGFVKRAHIGALGLKPHIVLYQTVSLLNATCSDISAKHLFNPSHFKPSELARMRTILNENSPELNARERGGTHQLLTPAAAGPTLRQLFGLEGKKLKSIHRADAHVMELIGLAAEAEGKAKNLTGKALNEYIARRTEDVVDETQPTWDATTLSSLAREGRSSAALHLLVMFTSQRNKNLNIAVDAVQEYIHGPRTAAAKANLAKKVTIPTAVNATLIYAIGTAYWAGLKGIARLAGFHPKDDDDWKRHVTGIMERMLGNWIIVGDLASAAAINAMKGKEGTQAMFKRHRGTILFEALGNTLSAVLELSKFIEESRKDKRYKTGARKDEAKNVETFWRMVEKSSKAAGIIFGVPLQGVMMAAAPFLPQHQEKKSQKKDVEYQFE